MYTLMYLQKENVWKFFASYELHICVEQLSSIVL